MNSIRPDVLERLVLAKVFFARAEAAFRVPSDRPGIAMGVVLLQDAVEIALGALGDQLGARLGDDMRFHQYFDRINEVIRPDQLPYRRDLLLLNRHRVNIKHHGVPVDADAVRHLPVIVRSFLEEVCERLHLDFDLLSLRDALRDEQVKAALRAAEDAMNASDYRAALAKCAEGLYRGYERRYLAKLRDAMLGVEEGRVSFPRADEIRQRLDLLAAGVDYPTYLGVRSFLPRVGEDRDTKALVVQGDERRYWHPANWTEQNTRFAYSFVVDALVKLQREPGAQYVLRHYLDVFFDKVEPVGEEAVFYTGYPPGTPPRTRRRSLLTDVGLGDLADDRIEEQPSEARFTLRHGEWKVGYVFDSPREGVLAFYTQEEQGLNNFYVKAADVTVTSVPQDSVRFEGDGRVTIE